MMEKKDKAKITTDSASTVLLLNRLYQQIEGTIVQDPHPGLIIASHQFKEPYPLVNDIDLLCLATKSPPFLFVACASAVSSLLESRVMSKLSLGAFPFVVESESGVRVL